MEMEATKKPKKAALGRGLSSLLQNSSEPPRDPVREKLIAEEPAPPQRSSNGPHAFIIDIEKVMPNPDQPRTQFNKSQLEQLAASIKEKGIIQPIVVQPLENNTYKIVAGERRWRASQLAGVHRIPVVVREVSSDEDMLELALIENVQREDLNPIEEALAYRNLQDKYSYTQAKISEKIGKDRATIANSIRLLNLHKEVQQMLAESKITVGHAKALLALPSPEKQLSVARKIIAQKLNVRKTEKLIQEKSAPEKDELEIDISDKLVASMAEDLQKILGKKVKISYRNSRGKIALNFYSDDELTEIVEAIKRGWRRDHTK